MATDLADARMPEPLRYAVELLVPMAINGATLPPGYVVRLSADMVQMLLHLRRARWPRATTPSNPPR